MIQDIWYFMPVLNFLYAHSNSVGYLYKKVIFDEIREKDEEINVW